MLRPKRFKIARRLGPLVYDQAQTERFALSEARKKRGPVKDKHRKNISAYNLALRDKQRLRLYYGLPERQFKRYVKETSAKEGSPVLNLYSRLESRLDNVVYRVGLAPTHRAARQMVSHGHITVNGKKIRVASHTVSVGDVIGVREGSAGSVLFTAEKKEKVAAPHWVAENEKSHTWEVTGQPKMDDVPSAFNITSVVEFYSR
ncbi:MAG TPA: 30S ribosomal protein S4 [Candidatus Paceibacterota bacterium]|nr:30S ribosomal protein S4 [Candidatus Paceibacterota bacterium]